MRKYTRKSFDLDDASLAIVSKIIDFYCLRFVESEAPDESEAVALALLYWYCNHEQYELQEAPF